jgi:gliding motility-associated protein GldL
MAAAQSSQVEKYLNVAVSAAAVPVLLGALFKITHAPSADLWLKIGLYTEAAIFAIYAVYYFLGSGGAAPAKAAAVAGVAGGNPALQSIDKMLQDADITPTNLQKLSAGFQKLGTTVDKMGEIGDVVKSTGDFTANARTAAESLNAIKGALDKSAATMNSFSEASESTKQFHGQVQNLTKNMSSLNAIYELELQDTNNHLKAMNKFFGNLTEVSNSMQGSVADAQRAQEQIAALANNLSKLNNVYGNMLSAMQGR